MGMFDLNGDGRLSAGESYLKYKMMTGNGDMYDDDDDIEVTDDDDDDEDEVYSREELKDKLGDILKEVDEIREKLAQYRKELDDLNDKIGDQLDETDNLRNDMTYDQRDSGIGRLAEDMVDALNEAYNEMESIVDNIDAVADTLGIME